MMRLFLKIIEIMLVISLFGLMLYYILIEYDFVKWILSFIALMSVLNYEKSNYK